MSEECNGMEALPGGPGVEELCNIVRNGPNHLRESALIHLLDKKEDELVETCLMETFRNKKADPGLRTAAIRTLCHRRPESSRGLMIESPQDDAIKREVPWWPAFRDGIEVPIDTCVAGMTRSVTGINRIHAAWVREHGDIAGRPEVVGVLARWRIATGQATEDDILLHGQPEQKKVMLRDLARSKGAGAIPLLRSCLRASGPRKATTQAFRELRRMKDAAIPALIEMLGSKHWGERKAGVGLLRHWGKLSDTQRKHAMSDPHIAVRHACLGRRWIHPR